MLGRAHSVWGSIELLRPGFRVSAIALGFAALLLASHVASAALSTDRLPAEDVRLAYLDPGSGSFMVQALIAALAGVGVAGRRYWTQIKSWLGLETKSLDDEFDPDDD